MGRLEVPCVKHTAWAAQYNTGLLIKSAPKGVVFYFLFITYFAVAQVLEQLLSAQLFYSRLQTSGLP